MLRGRVQQEKWFISHSYKDEVCLQSLIRALPQNIVPVVFPAINTPVTEFVSEPILKQIENCECLVLLDTPNSQASFWVALEIEHAKRFQKQIFKFSPTELTLAQDNSPAIQLPIYISFARDDETRVREIALWAKHKRNFDLWYEEQIGVLNDIFARTEVELERTIKAGGYLVAFVSTWSATRGNLRNEVMKAKEISDTSVLLAWLDDPPYLSIPGVTVPDEMQVFLRPAMPHDFRHSSAGVQRRELNSILSGRDLPVLARDIDDLIVRIYWLRWSACR